jgi:hypothetical protein
MIMEIIAQLSHVEPLAGYIMWSYLNVHHDTMSTLKSTKHLYRSHVRKTEILAPQSPYMSKRKASAPATDAGRRSKRSKTTTNQAFVWNPREWKQTRRVTGNVSVLVKVSDRNRKVVKKVLEVGVNLADDPFPLEVWAITMLPECNRIVKPIYYASDDPDEEHGTVFFEYYPLGDVRQWKEAGFDAKNNKPVPESHIWRFFLQMSQAVAVSPEPGWA